MIGLVCGTEEGFAAMVLYLAAYLFMNLGAFACIILFSLRTGSDRISDYAGLYQERSADHLGLSLCLLSLVAFRRCWVSSARSTSSSPAGLIINICLSSSVWITSVVSIYYYISVIKDDGGERSLRKPLMWSRPIRRSPGISLGCSRCGLPWWPAC